MNQILSTEDINNVKSKRNKSNNKDIKSVIKFFAIMLILFGVLLIVSTIYSMVVNNNGENAETTTSTSKPEIQIEKKGDDKLIISIMHEEEIKEVEYYWNTEEKKEKLNGEGRKYMQLKLNIPTGENTLVIKAVDVNGQETESTENYTLQKEIDITMEKSGNNVKINVKSENEIKNIEYQWDNGETKKIEVNEKEYSFELETSLGEHKLTVSATDVNDKKEEEQITVSGATKPTVTIEAGDNCYIIKAHDDIGLKRVEIETVKDGKVTKMQPDGKDFEYNYPLKEGDDNYIKVTAYNTKGVASKIKPAVWKK